jgi:U3 small nucleolar RNA-associated protein 22
MALHHPKAFAKDALAMQRISVDLSSSPPPPVKAYRSASIATSNTSLNEVIFLDASGWLNLASYISSGALKQAQVCAKRTAALLSVSAGPDAFDAAFLAGYPFVSLYDVWYKVAIPAVEEEKKIDLQPKSAQKSETRASEKKKTTAAAAKAAAEVKGGYSSRSYAADVPEWLKIDKKAVEIATKALGTRATLVRAIYRNCSVYDTNRGNSNNKSRSSVGPIFGPSREYTLIAARIDPTSALRAVDIGPAADSGAPATQFRAFWGEKSELRRFQDGKICEAVVWETTPSQRHLIVDDIVQYALQRHLPSGTRVSRCSGLLDEALNRQYSTADDDVAATRLVEAAAARLGKKLRALDGLPLKIVGTQPLAPVLRHADVFPPLPHLLVGAAASVDLTDDHTTTYPSSSTSSTIPRCLPAVELLCQLEGSGKWPDGPAAFAKMKAAVGVQLAQLLHSGFGLEASAAEEYVDILSEGFAFRLILHTERDMAMQQMALTASGMPHLPPEEDIALKMWHHGVISAAAAANPAFEPSVRLAKRWIASQWLSPHFRDEVIELLVAAAFAAGDDVIAPPPGSRVSGFLRFLHILGNHPWTAAPLVGDIAAGDPGPGRREVAARAHAAKKAAGEMGAPAMFITGPKDDQCVGWTREHPTKAMLHRAAVLARRAIYKLEEILIFSSSCNVGAAAESSTDVLESIFLHDESEYEIVIRLRKDALATHDTTLTRSKKNNMGPRTNRSQRGNSGWSTVEPLDSPEESKKSRAVLKGIPKSVIEARGAAAVRKELLIGFDPVRLYVSLLEDRFGAVAVPCADYVGGTSVGLKLRGPALQPGSVRPEAAHATKPLDGVLPKDFDDRLVVVPDLEAMAADCLGLGKGFVERVEYRKNL